MADRILAVVGAGGHGYVVAEAAQAQGPWRSIVLYDDDESVGRDLRGFTFGGPIARLRALGGGDGATDLIVAIGSNALRLELTRELRQLGFQLATVIHPSAVISPSVSIGPGSVVMGGVVINGRTQAGEACILNTRCSVDHDCRLADGVHVSPGVALAGGVAVGCCAWIGIGSAVIQGVNIGEHARVAAGAAVTRHVPDHATVAGCPAVVKSTRRLRDAQSSPMANGHS